MPAYSAPGVYFEPVDTRTQRIAALRTDVAAFVGLCERGPLARPVRIGSWQQFRAAFGGLAPNALLPWSVKAFFENGGRTCWVVRVAAPTLAMTTSGAQPVDRLSSNVADAKGFVDGAVVTLSQDVQTSTAGAQPADRLSSVVASGAGFAAGAAVVLSQSTLVLTAGAQPADKRSTIVTDVNGFEAGAIAEVMQIGSPTTYVRIAAVDAATKTIAWDIALDDAYDVTQTMAIRTTRRDARRVLRVSGSTVYWTGAFDSDFDLARAVKLQTKIRGERLVAPGVSATAIPWTRAYDDAFDLANSIELATGAAPATGVLLDSTSAPTLRVEAASPGAWGNAVSVVFARTSRLATQTSGTQPSDGAYSVVENVAGIAPGTVLKLFQSGALPMHRVVASIDAARNRIHWRAPLANIDVTQPISLESAELTLSVYEGPHLREIFEGLSLVREDERRYAPRVVEASHYVRLVDLNAPSPIPESHPGGERLQLAGGRDGIAAIQLQDVLDGLKTLEMIDDASFLAVPDVLIERVPALEVLPDPPPPPPDPCALTPTPTAPSPTPAPAQTLRERSATFDLAAVLLVQNAMIDQCERLRDRMAILDPPNFRSTSLNEIESWRRRFDTKYAALYFPWVTVVDPINTRDLTRAIPPSGHVAGVWARTDLATGVHKAPANEELRWAQDVTLEVTLPLHELLNPLGVNVIRPLPARGLRVYGARTVSSDPSWRYVSVRRLLIMIEEALEEALQWAVFEPHDAALREKIAMSIFGFLERLWQRGALAGETAGEAFFIRCNDANNPADAVANGYLLAEVGVAPVIPAEYVIFRIGRTEDVLEVTEQEGGL